MSNQVTAETKQVSTVLDKSIKATTAAISASNKALSEVQTGLETLLNKQVSLAQDIEYKGRELAEISTQTEQKLREAKIELEFKVRENEDAVRAELLKKAGLVATTQAELNRLSSELTVAQAAAQRTEFEAVSIAKQEITREKDAEIAELKSAHRVELAQLEANANSDKTTIALLNKQINDLQEQIKANREAEIKKAEAAANSQAVVVNTGK